MDSSNVDNSTTGIDVNNENFDEWNSNSRHLNEPVNDSDPINQIPTTRSQQQQQQQQISFDKEINNVNVQKDIVKPSIISKSLRDFDLLKIPMNSTVQSLLSKEDFYNVCYLCNGSHSNIFKVNTFFDEKLVILKVLSEDSLYHKIALEEFEREINILSRTNHCNIIELHGHGKIKSKINNHISKPLIVLEYLEGRTLAYHLVRNRHTHDRPFTELRYLRIAKEFADALYYLHDKLHPDCMLIHRDLKPDNIGFTANGTLKLMDFGLCICLNKHLNSSSNSNANNDNTNEMDDNNDNTNEMDDNNDDTNEMDDNNDDTNEMDDNNDNTNEMDDNVYELTGCTGSLRYMAPEVALNQPYNEKVDIYGFGLILYEIVTGVSPFTGMSREEHFTQVVLGNLRPNCKYDEYGKFVYAHPIIIELIQQCWDVNYIKRPSANRILDVLVKQEQLCSETENQKSYFSKSIDNVFRKVDPI